MKYRLKKLDIYEEYLTNTIANYYYRQLLQNKIETIRITNKIKSGRNNYEWGGVERGKIICLK